MEPSWLVLGPEPARFGPAPGQYRNRLIVHAAANAQRAVDLILGTTFEQEREASGIPVAIYRFSGLPPCSSLSSGWMPLSGSQILRGCNNARSLVRAKSQ